MIRSDGFYDYAWNPIEGCLNGCSYCYAQRDLTRRGKTFEPTFYPERLDEPLKVHGKRIFTDHYTDLMGDFIDKKWIAQIIYVIEHSDNTFIILTKNPHRYYDFNFPDNVILGVTIESPAQYWRAKAIEKLNNRKIASIEPLLGDFTGYDFSQFELVVVGGMIGAVIKHGQFVNTIRHPNIYYKPNIRRYLK